MMKNILILSLILIGILGCDNDEEPSLPNQIGVSAMIMQAPSSPPCDYFILYGNEPYFPTNLPDSLKINMQQVRLTFEYTGNTHDCIYTIDSLSETETLQMVNILDIEKL